MVWACGRRGRCGADVVPYIVMDGLSRRRGVFEVVDVGIRFVVCWREARSWVPLVVDPMVEE